MIGGLRDNNYLKNSLNSYMTVEQRKIELINSITSIDNESLLLRMEELIQESNSEVPKAIMRLLELSDKSGITKEHRSVRDLLK